MRRALLLLLYLVSFAILGYFAWRGAHYYWTPLPARPRHPLYWDLKPGGRLGLRFGVAGAGMMFLMLVYSLRKRLSTLRRAGRLSAWLDLHIYLGVCGPLLAVLHSSFKVQGLVAIAFWSMVIVAVSGVCGRFLYSQIPRGRAGDALSLAEAQALDRQLAERLAADFGFSTAALERLDELAMEGVDREAGLWRALAALLLYRLGLSRRLRRFRRDHRFLPRRQFRRWERVARQKAMLSRRLLLWDRLHELFHYWHVFHKPFAVLLYLFLVVHIVVAWMTGYAPGGGP